MPYWIVWKYSPGGEKYVSGTDDEFGYPFYTEKRDKAHKFYNFSEAMSYFNTGHCISKEYE